MFIPFDIVFHIKNVLFLKNTKNISKNMLLIKDFLYNVKKKRIGNEIIFLAKEMPYSNLPKATTFRPNKNLSLRGVFS